MGLLIYDGECAFCTRWAHWALRHLYTSRHALSIQPYQTADLARVGLTTQHCAQAVQWVAPDGQVSSGEAAVARLLLAGRWWAKPLGAGLLLPGIRQSARWVYRRVAARR